VEVYLAMNRDDRVGVGAFVYADLEVHSVDAPLSLPVVLKL